MADEKPKIINQAEDFLQIYPRPPLLTSLQTNWQGFGLVYMCQPAFALPEVASSQWHSITIFTHGDRPIYADRRLDGRRQYEPVFGGNIVITPANVGHGAVWDAEGDFINLAIEFPAFLKTIDESMEAETWELLPQFAISDPLVYQIGLALKKVLENAARGSRLYADTMLNALSMHLLHNYCKRQPQIPEYCGGLPQRRLKLVLDYIQSHLEQDLGLEELAKLANLSPHYFAQLFKQSMGMTPHQYVIQQRVEKAKELLLQGNLPIADVAYEVGFANQSHLNRHFKRLLGVTPKAIAAV
ncbi:helix-turn-helix domain-containing protein [Calothrix sp. 336/3]|uniref:helix-turn-helix domain-containing protein n=1 Tax=Calothrix sp. 336/3 TaxID=1337936 RepID=UPI0004E323B4|nr:AraC family transcriptional regulator [Calothrix sp. 336/3]AKG22009.1 DNA-binding protein [Calothrix sp. 336/3]